MHAPMPRAAWSSLILVAALLTALACTPREKAPGPTGEEGPATAPATAVDDPVQAMRGQWTVDVDRLPEQDNFKRMPEQQRALALEMARNLLTSMTVEFTADRYSLTTGGKSVAGRYTITAQSDRSLTLELTEDGAADTEVMTLTVDSRGLLMKAADDEALPLTRKPPPDSGGK